LNQSARQQVECATVIGTENAEVSPVKCGNLSFAERLATAKDGRIDESELLVREPGLEAGSGKSD
jgi:hypothetical protein